MIDYEQAMKIRDTITPGSMVTPEQEQLLDALGITPGDFKDADDIASKVKTAITERIKRWGDGT
jgi:hypothetical protein